MDQTADSRVCEFPRKTRTGFHKCLLWNNLILSDFQRLKGSVWIQIWGETGIMMKGNRKEAFNSFILLGVTGSWSPPHTLQAFSLLPPLYPLNNYVKGSGQARWAFSRMWNTILSIRPHLSVLFAEAFLAFVSLPTSHTQAAAAQWIHLFGHFGSLTSNLSLEKLSILCTSISSSKTTDNTLL